MALEAEAEIGWLAFMEALEPLDALKDARRDPREREAAGGLDLPEPEGTLLEPEPEGTFLDLLEPEPEGTFEADIIKSQKNV